MATEEELEALPSNELHDRAMHLAWRRLDIGFVWEVLKMIPEARAAIGDEERSEADIMDTTALLNDFVESDEGALADALRPVYIEYLLKHGGDEEPRDRSDQADARGSATEETRDDG
jgi:hypothetical protein